MPSQDKKELIEKYGESLFAADGDTASTAQTTPAKGEGEKVAPASKKSSGSHRHSGSHHRHSSSKKHSSHKSKSHKSSSHKHRSSKKTSGVKKLVRSGKYRFLSFFAKRKPISQKTEQKLRKISIITIVVLVVAILVAFLVIALKDMEAEEKVNDQIKQMQSDQTIEQLTAEKNKLEGELEALKQEYKENTATIGRAIIIAVDPTAATLDNMSAKMDKYNYDGVIALSSKYFRSNSSYASTDKINQLARKGWDVAIVIDSEIEFKSVYNKCISNGLGIPKAVYARNARITDTLCDKIEDKKMSLVFHSPNNSTPDRDLIYVITLPYNGTNTKDTFLAYNEEGTNLGCVVSSETAGGEYYDAPFEKMLTVFDGQKKGNDIAVTTASAEIYRVKDYSKQTENQDQSYETQISSLEARIKQIDELIAQKQNEYYNKNS